MFYLYIPICYLFAKKIFFLGFIFFINEKKYAKVLGIKSDMMTERKMIKFFKYIACFFCLFLSLSAPAYGTDFPSAISEDGSLVSEGELPWKIYADSLVSKNDGVVIEGRGNVLLVRGEDYLKADFARLYTNTQWILLQGNVYAKLGADEVEAKEAEFDLNNSTGWLKDAKLFLAGPHMYFNSDEVIKKGESEYSLVKAKATTCDGSVPLWKIEAEKADLAVDSYAHFSNVVFNIKDKGVFYTPYFFAPTKTTRQSGLLLPDYGVSSTQGVYYTQPYYHVIDQSRDLTLYGTIIEEKGFMPSVEYRSHTKENEKMWAMLDFLYDDQTVSSDREDDVDGTDGNIRTNRTRYWLRAMGNGDVLDSEWKYKYNLDYVSDQNFIREFSNRMTGYDNTKDHSFEMFGRNFNEADENRVTQGFAYRNFDRFYVTAGMKYTQDPRYGHGNLDRRYDTTVQELPVVGIYWNRDKVQEELPFEWNMLSSMGYYYRRSGTKGAKGEVYPELVLPINLGFLRGEIAGGARATLYTAISGDDTSILSSGGLRRQQDDSTRFIPDFRTNLYAQAERVWHFDEENAPLSENVGKREFVALKHTVQPRVGYEWTKYADQEDNPFFTLEDRIQKQSNFKFRLDNIFTAKQSSVVRQKDGIKKVNSYLDMVSFIVETGYDFREADRTKHTLQYDNRPWHDLRSRLVVRPRKWFSIDSDVYYSFYDGKINAVDLGTTLYHEKYGSFSTSYSQREPNFDYRRFVNYDNIADIVPTSSINVITNTLRLYPVSNVNVYIMERTNLDTGKSYERIAGLGYKHQCVYLYGEYSKDPIEERFSFNIELTGLGF